MGARGRGAEGGETKRVRGEGGREGWGKDRESEGGGETKRVRGEGGGAKTE